MEIISASTYFQITAKFQIKTTVYSDFKMKLTEYIEFLFKCSAPKTTQLILKVPRNSLTIKRKH